MAKQKRFYYVLVQSEGKAKFVTGIEDRSYARWQSDGKPLPLSKAMAEDIAFGLNLNFFQQLL